MDDHIQTIFSLGYLDEKLSAVEKRGERITAMRVGTELRDLFIAEAGDEYSAGAFRGIPVTFDAIDPAGISFDSEATT